MRFAYLLTVTFCSHSWWLVASLPRYYWLLAVLKTANASH